MKKYTETRGRVLFGLFLTFLSTAPIVGAPAIAGAIPSTDTVTFFENDSVSDNTSTYQLGTSAQDLTAFANLKSFVFKRRIYLR